MRRAIKAYLPSFLAVAAVMLLALGVGAYILSNQRLRFPLLEESPKKIERCSPTPRRWNPARASRCAWPASRSAPSARSGSRTAGRVVTLEIEPKFKDLVSDDATALLRSKTGLKDMFVEVDPGHGATLPAGGRIALSDTLPDVNLDEVLAVLDGDTRPYLQLLVTGGGKGTRGPRRGPVQDAAPAGPAAARHAPGVRRAGRAQPTCAGWSTATAA